MTFADCAGDVRLLFEEWGLEKATVMGHSLGGKVAMRFACESPDLVERLIVLDIAPREYEPEMNYIAALQELDLTIMDRRRDVEEALSDIVEDPGTRSFLLTNLRRNEDQEFYWLPNLEVLKKRRATIAAVPLEAGQVFDGPTDWIVGGKSDYVRAGDLALMRKHFPEVKRHVLKGAGHNVHVDGGQEFLDLVL